jgi:hypothetical protein
MNTYLIFFGKSQDFTFHAFDSSKYIDDFDSIIKDFDELESKVFTIDDVSNKEILSKYNFIKNDKKYSLIKLYSLGQATNGSRVSGSIYGVALLSDGELELSETNNAILSSVKKSFANLCLDGAKFKSSDFYQEAEKIWKAIINHKEGNYFNKINYRNGIFNTNNKVKAFYINDIIKNSFEVNNEINNTSRLYFSNDLEHLKRTQGKWGKEIFPIYAKENNLFVLYTEKPKPQPQPKPDSGSQDPEKTDLLFRNAELRNELSGFERKYRKFKETANQKFKIASILAIVFCLTTITFFFKNDFFGDDKTIPGNGGTVEGAPVKGGDKKNQINLNDILADDTNRNTLSTLLQNIEKYEASVNKKKYSEAIVRDAEKLGLDFAFYDNYVIKDNPEETFEEPKKEEPKKEEPKKEGPKKEEPKKEGPKKEGPKKEGPKKEEPKKEEPKKEEPKKEEPKKEEPKKEEPKKEEPKKEEPKKGAEVKNN